VWSIGAHYHKGLPIINSKIDDSDTDIDAPHAQFDKVSIDITYLKPIRFLYYPMTLTSTGHAQYSRTGLYSSEQISIGSLYSVRGFKENSIQGDSGWYWRNEVSSTLYDVFPITLIQEAAPNLRIFGGFDMGYVHQTNGTLQNQGEGFLSGASIGLKYNNGTLNWQIAYAKPLSTPSFVVKNDHEFYFNVALMVL